MKNNKTVKAVQQKPLAEYSKTAEKSDKADNSINTQRTEKKTLQQENKAEIVSVDLNKPYEEMSVEELQEAILEKMRKNGPVTEYMLGTVRENTHHGSLLNWVRSFNC